MSVPLYICKNSRTTDRSFLKFYIYMLHEKLSRCFTFLLDQTILAVPLREDIHVFLGTSLFTLMFCACAVLSCFEHLHALRSVHVQFLSCFEPIHKLNSVYVQLLSCFEPVLKLSFLHVQFLPTFEPVLKVQKYN